MTGRNRERAAVAAIALSCVGVGCSSTPHGAPGPDEPPVRWLLREGVTDEALERWHGNSMLHSLLPFAAEWPELREALGEIEAAWPDPSAVCAAVERANSALRATSFPYWIACEVSQGRPALSSFEVVGGATWRTSTREVLVRRLRPLDDLPIEMHPGGARLPVSAIPMDRLEAAVLAGLGTDADELPNPVDRVGLELWQTALGSQFPGLYGIQNAVFRRAKTLHKLEPALSEMGLPRAWRAPYDLSPRFFETLGQTHQSRPELLQELRERDDILHAQPAAEVLGQALEMDAMRQETHQARLALELETLPIPDELRQLAGSEDDGRLRDWNAELQASLGELHDDRSPKLVVAELARLAWGASAASDSRSVPARVILQELRPPYVDDSAALRRICDLSDAGLRKAAATLYLRFFGTSVEPIRRDPF